MAEPLTTVPTVVTSPEQQPQIDDFRVECRRNRETLVHGVDQSADRERGTGGKDGANQCGEPERSVQRWVGRPTDAEGPANVA